MLHPYGNDTLRTHSYTLVQCSPSYTGIIVVADFNREPISYAILLVSPILYDVRVPAMYCNTNVLITPGTYEHCFYRANKK